MLDRRKTASISRAASTPSRDRARAIDRVRLGTVFDKGERRRARIEAERDLADRQRWAKQAIRG